MSDKKRHVIVWGAIALALVAALALWSTPPAKEAMKTATDAIEQMGPWGPVAFAAVYIVAVVLLVPAAPMTLAAGVAFGAWAFPLVLAAATVGATLAFLVARYVARGRLTKYLEKRARLRAVDKAVSDEGWKVVMLMRLSPLVPFNLQNYLFGATDIRLRPYALATLVGMIPGTILYVYLGAAGKAALGEQGGGSPLQWGFFGIGIVATAVVAFVVARKARAKLAQAGVRKERS
jgi:uncharacterized membrane protein YdjX (TVP38/TMEM64 family)